MKKLLTFGLIFVLAFSLVACGKEKPIDDSNLIKDEDATSQATFSNDKAPVVEVDKNEFYIDNPSKNDSEYFFTKIKFVPADKNAKSVKFDLIILNEGSYITSYPIEESLDGKDDYVFEVRDEFDSLLPEDELKDIDVSNFEFDIQNVELNK